MAPNLVEAAKPFMDLSRRKLDHELDEAEDALWKMRPDLADATEDARRGAVRAVKEKARELEPAHRVAVARIADALEILAEALAEEKRLRGQVCSNGIDHLPALGLQILGIPADPNSAVSRWAADARRASYLE